MIDHKKNLLTSIEDIIKDHGQNNPDLVKALKQLNLSIELAIKTERGLDVAKYALQIASIAKTALDYFN